MIQYIKSNLVEFRNLAAGGWLSAFSLGGLRPPRSAPRDLKKLPLEGIAAKFGAKILRTSTQNSGEICK
jgi:hypothetical protein